MRVLIAPINRQTAIAFVPSPASLLAVSSAASCSSGLLPGSRMAKTMVEMKVPMNCGRVV